MKLVNLYHLVGVGVLALMALSFNLGFDECSTILGFGLIVVLVLGVHLMLDRINDNLYYHEKKLMELSDNIDCVKASVEIISSLSNHEMISSSLSLEQIKKEIEKVKVNIEELNNNLKG